MTEYFLWNYDDDDACALFSRKSQNCQGCSVASRGSGSHSVQRFVVQAHCSASQCMHTAKLWSAYTLQCFDSVVHLHCRVECQSCPASQCMYTPVLCSVCTLQCFLFVVQAHWRASALCMHTEELVVSHALGKVQSGLQSITRRKTSKMSLTHERNKDEQEITKKTKKFCILEEKSTFRC